MKNIDCVGHRDKSDIQVVFKPGGKEFKPDVGEYGQIVYHFTHKKRFDKHVIFTGRRIDRMNVTQPIPKHVYIAGHRCSTMYTNQDQERAQQQQEEAVEAEKKRQEAEEMRERAHKI